MSQLVVNNLSVEYEIESTWRTVVRDVSLQTRAGEVLGIVGESGCGKTTLARAMLGLLPRNARISSGEILLDQIDLLSLRPPELRSLRWNRLAMVFQGSMNVLNPVTRVGNQISEAINAHRRGMTRREVSEMVEKSLARVGIEPSRARSYPHELSGGQRQRIGIAMALALTPDIIIADEPTTALDVVTQDEVLGQLMRLHESSEFTLILISHDLAVIAETCDRVAVMYAGQIVELGTAADVFNSPAHPYTVGLLNAFREIGDNRPPVSIPGHPPAATETIRGCAFRRRCPFVSSECEHYPPWQELTDTHAERCFFPDRQFEFSERAAIPETWSQERSGGLSESRTNTPQ